MIGAVIVAGGSGIRMGAPVKKQYLHLGGRPLLCHTLMAFDRRADLDQIVLVIPEGDVNACQTTILGTLSLDHDIRLVAGGRRRQESVLNGLRSLGDADGVVMIHDGVRPFVSSALISRCLAGVQATGACIPALPVTDTLKEVDASGCILGTLDRKTVRLAQTPQTFAIELIQRAHGQAIQSGFAATDDASVAEFAGASVHTVSGDPANIKITTPHDLMLAQAIYQMWPVEDEDAVIPF